MAPPRTSKKGSNKSGKNKKTTITAQDDNIEVQMDANVNSQDPSLVSPGTNETGPTDMVLVSETQQNEPFRLQKRSDQDDDEDLLREFEFDDTGKTDEDFIYTGDEEHRDGILDEQREENKEEVFGDDSDDEDDDSVFSVIAKKRKASVNLKVEDDEDDDALDDILTSSGKKAKPKKEFKEKPTYIDKNPETPGNTSPEYQKQSLRVKYFGTFVDSNHQKKHYYGFFIGKTDSRFPSVLNKLAQKRILEDQEGWIFEKMDIEKKSAFFTPTEDRKSEHQNTDKNGNYPYNMVWYLFDSDEKLDHDKLEKLVIRFISKYFSRLLYCISRSLQ